MNIIIACEFSGVVREAFRAYGFNAISCDLLPPEDERFDYHYQGDVLDILYKHHWDAMLAFPPCTFLANSGVRWLHTQKDRWKKMEKGAKFFKALLDAPIQNKMIENPIMHKYALEIIGRKYDQIIQPWQFGHGETKATCLWLENLPTLKPTKIVDGRNPRVHYEAPSSDRWKERSRTLPGIAQAMADQWSEYIINDTRITVL